MTLIEIMVSVVLAGIILAAVYITFETQYLSYTAQSRVTETQQAGRIALDFLIRELRMAGFGITPSIAFVFNPCGDVGANQSDSIAFAYRDPKFLWAPITIGGGGSNVFGYPSGLLTIDTFTQGTIFWVVNYDHDNTAYFQAGCASCNPVSQLGTTGLFNPAGVSLPASFVNGWAQRVLYRRFFTDTTGTLMFDDTYPNGGGNLVPIASGIESIQFAYIMANGSEIYNDNACPNPASATPATQVDYADVSNIVNLRAIRVSVVARTSLPDKNWPGTVIAVENATVGSSTDHYHRRLYQATVNLWNMVNPGGYFTVRDY